MLRVRQREEERRKERGEGVTIGGYVLVCGLEQRKVLRIVALRPVQ